MAIRKVRARKSTLLQGLIGELPTSTDSISRSIRASAYCGQEPWLVNDTIQNNTLGQSTLEAQWYATVINAYALDKDLQSLQMGGLSVIGSKGISLWGGQKARVAFARAIYSRQPVAVVDDILSSLDCATEELAWENVFGQRGMFRQQAPIRSAIYEKMGPSLSKAPFQNLDLKDGYVHSLLVKEQAEKGESEGDDSEAPKKESTPGDSAEAPRADDPKRKTGNVALYSMYIKSFGAPHCLFILFLVVSSEFCIYFPQYRIKLWAEADNKHPGDRTTMFYDIYLGLAITGETLGAISVYYAYCVIMQASGVYWHKRLLNTIMGAPLSFFLS